MTSVLRIISVLLYGTVRIGIVSVSIALILGGLASFPNAQTFAQSLPPLIPSNTRLFSIPFDTANETVREVELMVSNDRGKHWHAAARQEVASKKFVFRAETDSEYWFAFRTISASGSTLVPFNGVPQLRVAVNAGTPTIVLLPQQQTAAGPVMPPKPAKFKDEANASRPQQPSRGEVKKAGTTPNKPAEPAPSGSVAGPTFAGFTPSAPSENPLDALLNNMGTFAGIQPVAMARQPEEKKDDAVPSVAAKPAGGITEITMNRQGAQPQIIVKWNPGDAIWQDAQIDILRKTAEQEVPVPIAVNLPNSGEYWWYLSPNDLKPFFITVRIRSLHGGILHNTTNSAIAIDPSVIRY